MRHIVGERCGPVLGSAALAVVLAAGLPPSFGTAVGRGDQPDVFRDRVAPLLASRCGTCHGPDRAESGFRIDLRPLAQAGGDSGAAGIVPGKPERSSVFVRVSTADADSRMPADGSRLSDAEQALLESWIAAGADWPDELHSLAGLLSDPEPNPARVRNHRAFQPLARPRVPSAAPDTTPIDAFVSEKIAAAGLARNPEADPRTLMRRVSFDLWGLPPCPEEMATFEAACRAAGGTDGPYLELVDRLLASPHYGERWARHWLDVVRFAESHGFEMNQARPNAWPYRDWVIESLNADKPYDQFVKEQLCGDQLGADAATGFLVGGPKDEVVSPDPVLTANQRADELHDIVGTTASAFLGLTVGCARCHDHKFDPIPQTDYYAMKAVFEGVRHGEREILPPDNDERLENIRALQAEIAPLRHRLSELLPKARFLRETGIDDLTADPTENLAKPVGTAAQGSLGERPHGQVAGGEHVDAFPFAREMLVRFSELSPNELAEMESLRDTVARLTDRLDSLTKLPRGYVGQFVSPERTHRFYRGDPMQPRDQVSPGSLTHFGAAWELPADAPETDRRRILADWIASSSNPLTARVIVNRLWHYHFGTGIVDTPSDLGLNGGVPSHPELLDWLASELVDPASPAERWRLKRIHRLIVTSRAYRQASTARPDGLATDSEARLLWRYPPRRLEAESLRDAILTVSGSLNPKRGGPGFDLFEPNTNYVKVYDTKTRFTEDDFRRMVYQSKPRIELDSFFGAFDCPDAGQIQPKRTSSTTPLQALSMMNGDFLLEQAIRFASRVEREVGGDLGLQVARAIEIAFGRPATDRELAAGCELVSAHGLPILCRSLYNANEFLMVY